VCTDNTCSLPIFEPADIAALAARAQPATRIAAKG
jgi:hypothetical protein